MRARWWWGGGWAACAGTCSPQVIRVPPTPPTHTCAPPGTPSPHPHLRAPLQAETELLKVHQMQLLEKEHSGCAALLRDDKVGCAQLALQERGCTGPAARRHAPPSPP